VNIYRVKIKQPSGTRLWNIIAATAIKARITATRFVDFSEPFIMVVAPAARFCGSPS
jgi:hypothetical protein